MEIQAIAGVSRIFFVIAVWKSLCFPKHLRYCLMNALPLPHSSPSAAVCCCCAVLLRCVRFLKGPYWRNHHHPWLLPPPILTWSLVVTSLFSRVCDVWVPSVLCFLLWSTKKKEALHCCCCRVLKGWFKVIAPDSYRVRSMSTPFIWEIPYFLHVFTVPLPNRSR